MSVIPYYMARRRLLGSAAGGDVPAQFGADDWSVADDGTGGDITITITTLPDDGGSAIADLEYQIDGGSWVSLGDTATGDYPVSGLTDDVEVDVAIRAVNAVGAGAASATKAVTPTLAFFPVVESTATSEAGTSGTFSPTLPAGIVAGDLLLLFYASGAGVNSGGITGYTNLFSGTKVRGLYRVATGSDGVSFGADFNRRVAVMYRISGYTGAPEASKTDVSLNPPSLSPSWGDKKTLWLAGLGGNAPTGWTPAPANYSNVVREAVTHAGDSIDPQIETWRRELKAASEDPPALAGTLSNPSAFTIAIQGA